MRFFAECSYDTTIQVVWADYDRLLELMEPQYREVRLLAEPKDEWFIPDSKSRVFRLPLIGIIKTASSYGVTVSNGRHRSAWLASLGHEAIPLAMPESQVVLGVEAGLVTRLAAAGDIIPNMEQYATPLAPRPPVDVEAIVNQVPFLAKLRR